MSGIVGIFNKGDRCAPRVRRPIAPHVLEQMLKTLAHRGPDGSKIWQGNGIGLGHCMLWTTPESLKEVLPYRNAAADLVITADARIDNRAELLNALALDVANASAISDSEIILAAYQKWEKDCPNHLLGDFAFAIWDSRQQTLFCARDHFGIKPFYYCNGDQYFIFASEIKALLSVPGVSRQLNERRIADYFLEPMLDSKSDTVYEEIFRLPPAHWVDVTAQADFNPRGYWLLDGTASVTLPTDEDYAAAFRDIFFEAVRCRLRSAFPVGSHLSGGLDSSAITCVAHELIGQSSHTLHTFSNIFDRISSCDEREYFNVVLEQGRYTSHFIEADRLGPLSEWQKFFRYLDEPFLGPSHFLVHGLNQATQASGVRICLDGFDGDTVVSHGSVYFTELARQGKWETFIAEAKAVSGHFDTSPGTILLGYAMPYIAELAQKHQWLTFAKRVNGISRIFKISRRKLWLQYGVKPYLPQWLLGVVHRLKCGTQKAKPSDDILSAIAVFNPRFAERLSIASLCKTRKLSQRHPQSVREDQDRDLSSGAFTYVLELSDQCASAFSIEVRHPFMDKRLVEFCLALPPEQKLKNGWSRSIMRRALAGVLPEPIRWRGGKASMEENFEQGLLHTDKSIVEQALSGDGSGSAKTFLNLALLQEQWQSFTSSPRHQQAQTTAVWKGTALSLWLTLQEQRNERD